MKKILFVIDSLGGGGAEKSLINLLNNIDYSLYDIDLLVFEEEGVYNKQVPQDVNVKYLFKKSKFKSITKNLKLIDTFFMIYNKILRRIAFKFPKLIYFFNIKKKFDVEIGFLQGNSTYFVTNSLNKNSKKIVWIHSDLSKRKDYPKKKERFYIESSDKIVCVSNDAKKALLQLYPKVIDKVEVIYNIVEKDYIEQKSKEMIEFNKTLPTIVAVGRLEAVKAYDKLILAHKMLIEEGIENELIIVGEGAQRENLEKIINEYGLKHVYLIGFKENPYPYINMADVYVMSSKYEGLPCVIMEALVLGKCVVSTKCTGTMELLNYGEIGILVEPNDIVALKDAIKKVIQNNDLRNYYTRKSLEKSKFFRKDEVVKQLYYLVDNV